MTGIKGSVRQNALFPNNIVTHSVSIVDADKQCS